MYKKMSDDAINDLAEEIIDNHSPVRDKCFIEEIADTYVPRPMLGHAFRMEVRPGCYSSIRSGESPSPDYMGESEEELFVFRDGGSEKIRYYIRSFKNMRQTAKEENTMHKMGLLIYGPPGSGKSTLLTQEIKRLVEQGGIVLNCDSPYRLESSILAFRDMEPIRDVFAVIEDIDEMVKGYGEHRLLETIGGIGSTNHIMFIATANNLEILSPKMRRAGRFDKKIEVPNPCIEQRHLYLSKKIGTRASKSAIKRLALQTEGLSFGHLRQLIMDVYGYKTSIKESLKSLRIDMETDRKRQEKAEKRSAMWEKCSGIEDYDEY